MHILILPGFSPKNEEWAESVKRDLHELGQVSIIRWSHWDTESTESGWIDKEVDKIVETLGEGEVIIIAKSTGTIVAMEALKDAKVKVSRLILCGIPINDFEEGDENRYQVLEDFDPKQIAVFQNNEDPHGNPVQVESLIHKFNPEIKVIIKSRDNHEYPYSEDFIKFISSNEDY